MLNPLLIYLGLGVFISVSASMVYSVVFGHLFTASGGIPDHMAAFKMTSDFLLENGLLLQLISNTVCVLIFALMWRKIRTDLPKHDNTKPGIPVIILAVILCVSLDVICASIIDLSNLIDLFPGYNEVAEYLFSGSIWVQFFLICIIAPLAEELLCRGIIMNRLCSWLPKWAAVLIPSVFFGMIHYNMIQGISAFFLGIVFSLLYLRYRSLWIPIICHMAINLFSFVLQVSVTEDISAWYFLISGIPLAIASALLILRRTKAAVLSDEPSGFGMDTARPVIGEGILRNEQV
jgi:membrane protease YdiL (CAAX protease family)